MYWSDRHGNYILGGGGKMIGMGIIYLGGKMIGMGIIYLGAKFKFEILSHDPFVTFLKMLRKQKPVVTVSVILVLANVTLNCTLS